MDDGGRLQLTKLGKMHFSGVITQYILSINVFRNVTVAPVPVHGVHVLTNLAVQAY